MKLYGVKSSNIQQMGYDESTKVLEVVYRGGAHYRYHDVPPELWYNLQRAPSVGKYLNRIRGGLRCERV